MRARGSRRRSSFCPTPAARPTGATIPKLLRLAPAKPNDPPLFAWSRKKDEDCEAVAHARAERREAEAGEHRRLLYVAMTRAAQRLVVAGYENIEGPRRRMLVRSCRIRPRGIDEPGLPRPGASGETIRRFGEGLFADDERRNAMPASDLGAAPRLALGREPPRRRAVRRCGPRDWAARARESGRVNEGRLAHALLQMLPDIPPARRDGRGEGLSRRAWRRARPSRRARRIAAQVVSVIWKRRNSRRCSAPARAAKCRWPACCGGPGAPMRPIAAASTACS